MIPLETILNRKDIVPWIYSMLLFSDPQIPSRKQIIRKPGYTYIGKYAKPALF